MLCGCGVPARPEGWGRAGAGIRAKQKLPPSWGSQGAELAVGPASAQRPGLSVDALSCLRPSSKSLPAALPAFQRVIRCISGVKKPGRGFREAEPPEALGPRPGAAPLKGRGLRPRLRGPATQRSEPGASLRAEGPPLAFPPLAARPAPTSSAPGGHAQTARAASLQPGSGLGREPGARHSQRPGTALGPRPEGGRGRESREQGNPGRAHLERAVNCERGRDGPVLANPVHRGQ